MLTTLGPDGYFSTDAATDYALQARLAEHLRDRKAAGDSKGSEDALHQVMSSPGVDLIETAMARDLLSGASALIGPPPANVPLP